MGLDQLKAGGGLLVYSGIEFGFGFREKKKLLRG
jgi:hypothetical protein